MKPSNTPILSRAGISKAREEKLQRLLNKYLHYLHNLSNKDLEFILDSDSVTYLGAITGTRDIDD